MLKYTFQGLKLVVRGSITCGERPIRVTDAQVHVPGLEAGRARLHNMR